MHAKHLPVFAAALSLALCIAANANAQSAPAKSDDQFIDFKDADLLSGEALQFLGDTVRPPIKPYRVYLLRPRTSFVSELYKSLEQI